MTCNITLFHHSLLPPLPSLSLSLPTSINSHQLIVLADGFRYLGFGDADSLDLEFRSHTNEVLLQSCLQASVIWYERGWECEKGTCEEGAEGGLECESRV